MLKLSLACLSTLLIVGCGSTQYSNKPYMQKVESTTIEVEKPSGNAFISPTVYKEYSCEELNEEFIGVSRASLQNLLGEVDNITSSGMRRSVVERQTQELKSQEYNNNQSSNEARLYALTKAAYKIEGCKMYMNKKEIVLAE